MFSNPKETFSFDNIVKSKEKTQIIDQARGKKKGSSSERVVKSGTGDRENVGHLGLGQYRTNKRKIDQSVFKKRDNRLKREIRGYRDDVEGRHAPTANAATIDMDPQAQFRQQQMGLAKQLQQQAMGQGPSLAQGQLQQATDRNIAQQMAMAASGGGNPALGMRGAMDNAAAMNQQAAQESALLRMQEQMNAQGLLGQVSGQARGMDIGLATDQAGLQQQANLANQQARLAQTQMDDAAINAMNNQLMGLGQGDRSAAMAGEQLAVGQDLGYEQLNEKAYNNAGNRRVNAGGKFMDGLGSAFGGIMSMMSDENVKTDIEPGDEKLSKFFEAIGTHSYKYKNPKHGEGTHISPMAQELEKTELGKSLVIDTPEGKAVNYGKAGGLFLSSAANLHKRLSDLEGFLKHQAMGAKRA